MQTAIKENIGIKGRYRLIEADSRLAREEYQALLNFLERFPIDSIQTPAGREWHGLKYRALLRAYHEKAAVAERVVDNLIPTVGRTALAQRLANTLTYTGVVNYAAIGSGTTAPADGDTQLGTEVYRQTMSSQTYTNNIASLSVFIAAGTATGTHTEGGLFIDGTAVADSGQIFSHVLFSPSIVKGALNSLTLDISLTIS